ncbi:MAG: acylneuraminate cytidylyltransferase family protein [Paludibacteraceae bacterium]|nr:acylneuraminate cytidylyltransferase family protein [Paludibacteraceae bacterium]
MKRKVVAIVPMKLNNQRLPGKNIMSFDGGDPLCCYILNTLKKVSEIEEIFVFCSNPEIKKYLPEGITYMKRSEELDRDTTSMNEVLSAFADEVEADVYVMTHATSPFVSSDSIRKGLLSVLSGEHDSAFAVKRIQKFLWKDDEPLNYSLDKIARTQDLPPIYEETSGFYIYRRPIIKDMNRRIGVNPIKIEVSDMEAVDIDEKSDFDLANMIYQNFIK